MARAVVVFCPVVNPDRMPLALSRACSASCCGERSRVVVSAIGGSCAHQTCILMISLNDSSALLRTATVSSVASCACVAAIM